jgi:two-component system chemotaxis sensor kinase CheA
VVVPSVPASVSQAAAPSPATPAPVATVQGLRQLEISVTKLDRPDQADALMELFRDIPGLGDIRAVPPTDGADRVFHVDTTSSDEDLLDLFAFHVSREQVRIVVKSSEVSTSSTGQGQSLTEAAHAAAPVAEAFGFFDNAPGGPGSSESQIAVAVDPGSKGVKAAIRPPAASGAVPPEAATIRVAISKVDQLINLVGELVITQAMLAQNSRALDPALYQQLLSGLTDLDRNTRDLQESVMSIRMIPMSIVFSRFPRMLRDLAGKLGKKVEFVTQGEATELDKGLVEKITDPLTH